LAIWRVAAWLYSAPTLHTMPQTARGFVFVLSHVVGMTRRCLFALVRGRGRGRVGVRGHCSLAKYASFWSIQDVGTSDSAFQWAQRFRPCALPFSLSRFFVRPSREKTRPSSCYQPDLRLSARMQTVRVTSTYFTLHPLDLRRVVVSAKQLATTHLAALTYVLLSALSCHIPFLTVYAVVSRSAVSMPVAGPSRPY
jgi:hypothetical protein